MVTCQQQLLLLLIPETKGEDALQMGDAILPPFNICMQEYFSIGLCTKCVSLTFKFAAQFAEVINFPIIGESIGITVFLVDHWLLSALWVDHNQAAMCQCRTRRYPAPLRIRPSATERISHALYC